MLHQRGEVPRHASALFVVGALIAGVVCYQSYASSDAQVTPTLAPGVDGGLTASVSVAGAVTTEPSYLLLDKNFLSFTGSFDVFDAFGVDVYYVKGKVVSLRKRKAIVPLTTGSVNEAATSPPLAFVQKKLVGLRKVYEIYRYTPAFEGQEATEKDDSEVPLPLYRYGWVQRGLVSIPTAKYFYALDKGEKDPTPVLQATERFNLNPFKPFMMDVTRPGEEVSAATTLATIGKATNFHFRRDASWMIEVAQGMDLLGMLILGIAVNEIMEDVEDENDNGRR